jgi:hypothetical protein
MSGDDTMQVQRLRAARVFIQRNGDDDVILRITGAIDGDHNFVLSREEFVRLTQSLNQDAMRLSTMQKGDKPL